MTMQEAAQVPTPELDKQSKIIHTERPQTEVLGEFYEWLQSEGLAICRLSDTGRYKHGDSQPTHEYVPLYEGFNVTLARFFGIDLDKIEQERRALLEAIRNMPDPEEQPA